MSMITATTWVPRGFAAPFPKKYDFTEEEFERIAHLAKLHLDDANEDLEEAEDEQKIGEDEAGESRTGASNPKTQSESKEKSAAKKDQEMDKSKDTGDIDLSDDDLKEYDMEHYDDDEDDDEAAANSGAAGQGVAMGMFGNVKSLAYYENNEEDPYITLKEGAAPGGDDDDDDDDRADLQILATDNLLLAAKVEDELAHLEVCVYEDEADNLYVHHDIMLPAIPLCVEWLDIAVEKKGVGRDAAANFVAVGTMDPDIEIWDLDTIDCMYPNAILGQGGEAEQAAAKGKKKKKKKSKKANDNHHVDAVLALAASRKHRNLLASASADRTVKLWDLHTTKCAKSYNSLHTDKVCSLAWHAVESTVLLTGSYDRTVAAADMRAPDARPPRWGVESDVECVRWDPHDPDFFFVTTENGAVHYHDVRAAPSAPEATKAVWTLQAHDEAVSSFDVNPVVPGFLATGSSDKTVKLWNVTATGPSMVVSRNLDVGRVFSTNFAPDPEVAFRLAVAGSKGATTIWDTSTNAAVRRAFAAKVPAAKPGEEVKERLVGVNNAGDDSEESSSEDYDDEENGSDESMDDV